MTNAVVYVDSNQAPLFQTTTAYALGDVVTPTNTEASYWTFECTTAGTSGGTEPAWTSTLGATTVSGTATFTARAGTSWAVPFGALSTVGYNFTALTNTGVTVKVASDHVEPATTTKTLFNNLTSGRHASCVSVNSTTDQYERGAKIYGNTTMNIYGSCAFYGFDFIHGTGAASAAHINFRSSTNGYKQTFSDCKFQLTNTTGSHWKLGTVASANGLAVFNDCWFKAAATDSQCIFYAGKVWFNGGGIDPASAAIDEFLNPADGGGHAEFNGFDFSAMAAAGYMVGSSESTTDPYVKVETTGCKLSSSFVAPGPAGTYTGAMDVIHKGSNGYPYLLTGVQGQSTINHTTAVYRAAFIDSQGVSWYISTPASTKRVTRTPFVAHWLPAGTYTLTMHTLMDAAAGLPEYHCWCEVLYPNSATKGLLGIATSFEGIDVTTTDASATEGEWTKGAAGTGWIGQIHPVTITTLSDGYVYWRGVVFKQSTNIYICPAIEVA